MPFQHSPSETSHARPAATPEARALAVVRGLAEPLCAAHGVVLVDVAWTTEHGARVLRVTIERLTHEGKGRTPEEGWGVSLEHCADLSRDLSAALDRDEEAVPGSYTLEVSSPGLERELFTVEDLARFRGYLAKVKLARPAADGQRLLRGTLLRLSEPAASEPAAAGEAARPRTLTMRVDKKELTVPVADVVHANLVFELPTARSSGERAGDRPAGRAPTKGRPPKGRARESTPKRAPPDQATRASGSGAGQRSTSRQVGVKGSGS